MPFFLRILQLQDTLDRVSNVENANLLSKCLRCSPNNSYATSFRSFTQRHWIRLHLSLVKPFRWSPSAPSTSATKGRCILSSHQVTTGRTTPRKGLFHHTGSPLQARSPGALPISSARGRGSLSSHQVTTRQTTPRKGLFHPTVTTPPPRARGKVERQEAADSPGKRL